MTKIVWLTDIHLNFVEAERRDEFLNRVRQTRASAVLIGGDIGEAHSVIEYLQLLDDYWRIPIYFVLGNHDFYYGSIHQWRQKVEQLCTERDRLTYLSRGPAPIRLTDSVGLVGHDGWADARSGDYDRSSILLNDYRLINELSGRSKAERKQILQALGDEAAKHIRDLLPDALRDFRTVIVLTHVPPMREACWHEGRVSDDQWAPHFTCQALGNACLEIMRDFPDRQLRVLCGHTHGSGTTRPLPNVEVITGGAIYGDPKIAGTFELPD